jgi:hypothetical protein
MRPRVSATGTNRLFHLDGSNDYDGLAFRDTCVRNGVNTYGFFVEGWRRNRSGPCRRECCDDAGTHLVCYQVRSAAGSPTSDTLYSLNQFGPDEFRVFGARELCVPSTIQ